MFYVFDPSGSALKLLWLGWHMFCCIVGISNAVYKVVLVMYALFVILVIIVYILHCIIYVHRITCNMIVPCCILYLCS